MIETKIELCVSIFVFSYRMGALDVCPFIPISDVTVAECVEISKKFGARLAEEVGVPVFLYGAASETEYRKTMPQIRAGEYEGLEEKVRVPLHLVWYLYLNILVERGEVGP